MGLSLAFSYVPKLSDTFEQQDATKKRLIMAGLLVGVAVILFALGCTNIYSTVTCDQAGAEGLARALLAALVANQATYQITKS